MVVVREPGMLSQCRIISVPADLPPAPPLNALTLAELPVGLPSEVLLQRPDIRAAEQQLIAANANIGAARAAFFPRISLTAALGVASSGLSGLFDGGSGAWTFQPALALPLFDSYLLRETISDFKEHHTCETVTIVTFIDKNYPVFLPYQHPIFLFVRG